MHTWDFDRQQPLLCGMEMCAGDEPGEQGTAEE